MPAFSGNFSRAGGICSGGFVQVELGARLASFSGGGLKLAGLKKMTSSAINALQCSSIDGGDGGSDSFSFGSTALALSCDELPPSPCLRGVRGSKVRDRNGGAESGAEGVSALTAEESERALRERERAPTRSFFFFFFFRKK